MGVKSYNFKQVAVIVGPNIITGFADGESIVVEPNEDLYSYQPGNDGSGTRSANNNFSGRIRLILQQAAASNAILQAIANSDRVSGAGVLPVAIKDNSGATLHFAETAWIARQPNASYGRESGSREWILESDNIVFGEGGNT